MEPAKFVDRASCLLAIAAFVLSFLLFFSDTLEITKSLVAALLLGGLVWLSYVMIRWVYLALRK